MGLLTHFGKNIWCVCMLVMCTHQYAFSQTNSTDSVDVVIDPPHPFLTACMFSAAAISEIIPMPWTADDYDHTTADILLLNENQLPAIDRIVFPLSENRIAIAKPASDVLAGSSFAFPIWASFFVTHSNDDLVNLGIVYFCGYFTGAVGVDHLKSIFDRARPYNYTLDIEVENRYTPEGWSSMPSGHSFTSAYNCFFGASILDRYYLENDQTKMRVILWSAAATYPLLTGYMRMLAGRHFTTDVFVGYGIGAGLGLAFPLLMEDHGKNDITWMPYLEPNLMGMGMRLQF